MIVEVAARTSHRVNMCFPTSARSVRARRPSQWAFGALSMLVLASCGDDGTGPVAPVVPVPTSIVLEPSSLAFEALGAGAAVSARVLDQEGRPMTDVLAEWASDDPAVASVTASGRVTAVENGTTTVRVSAGRAQADLVVSVSQTVASAMLVADSVLLSGRGEVVRLRPSYADALGNPVEGSGATSTWTSRDPRVASVDADGLVTAGAEGSAWVVASLSEPSDSVLVTVQLLGAITVTFDDGFLSVYENAWPVFREFDIQANVAVNPVPVDLGWSTYLTHDMLDELSEAGWSIVSHSLEHDSLPSLSPSELDYDLRTSQQWIIDRGYRGWNVFVAPYHAYGPAERAAVSQHYDASRGLSSSQFVPDSLVPWMPDDPHQLTAREADLLPYTTAAGRDELRTLLRRVLDEGAFLDIFFHRVPAENVSALRELLVVLDEFRPRVLPYHELFPVTTRTVY